LKPGMSATVEIVTEKMDEKVFIPLESVFGKEGKTIAYVLTSSWQEREIKVSKSNNNYIVVDEGLSVGEQVALRDPTVKLEQFGTEIKAPAARTSSSQGGAGAGSGQFNIEGIKDMMRGMGGMGRGGR